MAVREVYSGVLIRVFGLCMADSKDIFMGWYWGRNTVKG